MPKIRPYENKDKENVRNVCLATGPHNAYEPKQRAMLLACFCDYYIENEPENCFILADDQDDAVGYIFCAENFERFNKTFCKEYIGRAQKGGLLNGIYAWFTTIPPKFYAKRYPAHLHIDILPEFQRRGFGSKLMDANISNLKAKRVSAVMLVCGAHNKKGINFYNKYGFKKIINIFGFEAMGMNLKETVPFGATVPSV